MNLATEIQLSGLLSIKESGKGITVSGPSHNYRRGLVQLRDAVEGAIAEYDRLLKYDYASVKERAE